MAGGSRKLLLSASRRRLAGGPAGGTAATPHFRPRRIILLRHGESLGNVDEESYTRVPDWKIPLTAKGEQQAVRAGRELRAMLDEVAGARAYFYTSPYTRARQTLERVLEQLEPAHVIGVREEPRVSEQQFGNLQDAESMRRAKAERAAFGRFYYRFPQGESALDVYSRVSSFIATINRDVEQMRTNAVLTPETHIVIVAHGLSARTFVMRWFQLTVDDFETLSNQPNASLLVLELQRNSRGQQWYELTRASWERLNAHGLMDPDEMRAGGHPGSDGRRLVVDALAREPLDG